MKSHKGVWGNIDRTQTPYISPNLIIQKHNVQTKHTYFVESDSNSIIIHRCETILNT